MHSIKVIVAAWLTLFLLSPLAQASHVEPDFDEQLLAPLEESTPPALTIALVCDPLGLILCVGPITQNMPIVVTISSPGVNVTFWSHADDPSSIGPLQENLTVPVLGTVVPLLLCPSTCPVPTSPEFNTTGTEAVKVCWTYSASGSEACSDAPPFATEYTCTGNESPNDQDGDGTPDECDPDRDGDRYSNDLEDLMGPVADADDPSKPFVDSDRDSVPDDVEEAAGRDPNDERDTRPWETSCEDTDRSQRVYVCKKPDGRYLIYLYGVNTHLNDGAFNIP